MYTYYVFHSHKTKLLRISPVNDRQTWESLAMDVSGYNPVALVNTCKGFCCGAIFAATAGANGALEIRNTFSDFS